MSDSPDVIRVLHVDDEPDFAELTANFLEREGDRFDVETATNADDGLNRLTGKRFDCVVSDYDLRGRNGIQFLAAVREDHPDLPFILFTGKGSEEVASEAISAGVSDYLQKEGGTDQYAVLANRITNLVSQYRAIATVEEYASQREESEQYRQRLLRIISDRDRSDEEKIDRLLALGCERLGVENGHLVMIDEEADRHEVVSAVGGDIVREGVSDLSETYCRRTLESGDRLSLVHASEDGWAADPAYRTYGLECYIGGKLAANDRLFGTLCFVDAEPRDPFTPNEKAFFDLLVQWFSQMLERRRKLNQADAIFEHTQDAIFLIDVVDDGEFSIRTVNRAYEELTGLAAADLAGRTPRELLGEDQGAAVVERYRQCVEGREPIEYEERLTIDGDTRDWHTRLAPVLEDGRVVQLVGATRDVTDQKERKRKLDAEQRLVAAIFDAQPDPLYAFDTEGRPIRWNDRLTDVTGYGDEEIADMHVTDLVPADERETIAENFRAIVDERRVVTVESAFETKDGERIPHEFTGGPLVNPDGSLRGATGVGRDLTERKRRERELETMTRRLEAILDNTTTPMFMKAEDGEYIFVNRGYRDLFDLHDAAVVGKTDHDLHPPAVADAVGENDRAVIDRGEPMAFEERIVVDGEERTFLSSKVPIYDTGERCDPDDPIAVFGVASDITELRRREAELRRERDRLDEFASVVSHDIRSPLEVAEGRLELLRAECTSDHIAPIARALTRIDRVVEDVLALAREGEGSVEIERLSLASVIEASWDAVSAADATLRASVDRPIMADRDRLRRLLENLLRNAVEHGGSDVTVTVGELADGFYVEDDGPGIPAADRSAVFEGGYSTAREGTGYGLRIVEQVADGHGWDVRLTEGTDGGARVEITNVDPVD